MKSIALKFSVLILLVLIGQITFAQGRHHRMGKGSNLEALKEELNLTEDQQTQIKAIHEKHAAEIAQIKEKEFDSPTEKRKAFKAILEKQKEAIHEILTEEQLTIIQEKRNHIKERIGKIDREALKTEMEAFHKQKVKPVLLAQRAKLEEQISEEDKITISTLRTSIKPRMEMMKGNRRKGEFRKERGTRRPDNVSEEQKENRQILKALVEKYSEEIKALAAEIEEQQQQWQVERKAILEKYLPEKGEDGKFEGKMGHKRHHKSKGQGRHAQIGKMMRAAHFLLLNPNVDGEAILKDEKAQVEINVFPNPATTQNTINYNILKAGKIRIDLRDADGNLLRTLLDEFKEVGKYNLDVNLLDSRDGIYYYTVIGQEGVQSKK